MGGKLPPRSNSGDELVPTKPSRGLMYALVSLQGLPNWTIRGGLPSWIPFVVADMGLGDVERAALLAAWFPGYLITQIPGAALIDRVGPKVVLFGNMLGTCGLFLMLPLLARTLGSDSTARRVRVMASTLTLCGFFQGPLIPGTLLPLFCSSAIGFCCLERMHMCVRGSG